MILTNSKKNFLVYAFICPMVILFFVFGYPARANYLDYITDINNGNQCEIINCTNLGADIFAQTFKPTNNIIAGFSHKGTGWPADVYLCAGDRRSNEACGGEGNIIYHATTTPEYSATTSRSYYFFGENYDITAGQTYTFQMQYPSMNLTYTNTNNNYPDGVACRNSTGSWNCFSDAYDANFTTFYIEQAADYIEIINPENGTTQTNFTIDLGLSFTVSTSTLAEYDKIGVLVMDMSSTTGEWTNIFQEIYGETDLMSEDDMYIFYATTTVPHYGQHATVAYLEGIKNGDSVWYDITTSDVIFWEMVEEWTISDDEICAGVATSTIMGGIECAFKKLGYWAFYPSSGSVNNLKNSFTNLKSSFPFSVFFQLTDTMDSALSTTTTNMEGNFSVPMITATGTIFMQPVLSSSSLGMVVGQDNAILIRNSITWFMWIGAAFLVFLTFKKI